MRADSGLILLLALALPLRAADPVIVHEWGTFTCLQDESGTAIRGVNVDDEPVPSFVYQNAGIAVKDARSGFGLPTYSDFAIGGKGWFSGDPNVTMRLETPVLYIYPPKGKSARSVPPLNVHVDFLGGILSQSYPYSLREDPPSKTDGQPFKGITSETVSGLTWKNVRLGSKIKPVATEDKVWTTPREVSAPVLEVNAQTYDDQGHGHAEAQSEHFLFYRGIGHLDSPYRASFLRDEKGMVKLTGIGPATGLPFRVWILDVRGPRSCAFRIADERAGIISPGVSFDPAFATSFAEKEYGPGNLQKMKASMQAALMKEGLFADEASAMLRTWEASYFKSPGLRLFYIAPKAWVEQVLPLKVTGAPVEVTRVMVGRIELITDGQKAALARLATGPCPDLAGLKKTAQDAVEKKKLPENEAKAFKEGKKPLSELGIEIPPLAQDYLSMGRFRDVLVLHEQEVHPSPALAQFIKENRLSLGAN